MLPSSKCWCTPAFDVLRTGKGCLWSNEILILVECYPRLQVIWTEQYLAYSHALVPFLCLSQCPEQSSLTFHWWSCQRTTLTSFSRQPGSSCHRPSEVSRSRPLPRRRQSSSDRLAAALPLSPSWRRRCPTQSRGRKVSRPPLQDRPRCRAKPVWRVLAQVAALPSCVQAQSGSICLRWCLQLQVTQGFSLCVEYFALLVTQWTRIRAVVEFQSRGVSRRSARGQPSWCQAPCPLSWTHVLRASTFCSRHQALSDRLVLPSALLSSGLSFGFPTSYCSAEGWISSPLPLQSQWRILSLEQSRTSLRSLWRKLLFASVQS